MLKSIDTEIGEASAHSSQNAINLPYKDLTTGEAGPLSSQSAVALPSEDLEMQEAGSSKANRVIVCLRILSRDLVIIKTNHMYLSFK